MRDYELYYTQDGSIGLYSYADKDVYHSKFGAVTEAWEKFVLPSGIDKLINTKKEINILDICYGIGYNTKSLMSYIINSNEKYLNQKKEKFIFKIIKKILIKKKKNHISITNNDSIDANNTLISDKALLAFTETVDLNNLSHFNIECLDTNEELIKISPLLKTLITPHELFCRIIPRIFDCFDWYWQMRTFLKKIKVKFASKNKKDIEELLELKFGNDYKIIENEYRIHPFVNYIIIDALVDYYNKYYIDKSLNKLLKKRKVKRFFDSSLINYAKFKQNKGYKIISKFNLLAFLHNIYYDHLSNRYKNVVYNQVRSLFKLSFLPKDARKSILELNKQYDLIFLDAFTYSKAPELWTVEFIAELYRRLSPNGILMTYSNSALVRNTFLENNFYIGKILDKNTGKCIGTVATKEKNLIEHPLSSYELGLCATKAGIPYHDHTLSYSKEKILKLRELEFKNSDLMTSSQYMRSRMNKEVNNE